MSTSDHITPASRHHRQTQYTHTNKHHTAPTGSTHGEGEDNTRNTIQTPVNCTFNRSLFSAMDMYMYSLAVCPFYLPFVLFCLPLIIDLYRSSFYIAVRTNFEK